jgi:hypothetical protein
MIDLAMLADVWRWTACYWDTPHWQKLMTLITIPPVDSQNTLSQEAINAVVQNRITNLRPQEPTLQDIYWLWEDILAIVYQDYLKGDYGGLTEQKMIDLIEFFRVIMADIEEEILDGE